MPTMTKAQLVDENIRLRAHAAALEQRIASLEAAQQAKPRSTKPQPSAHTDYWDYVNACRTWCRAAKQPVSYMLPSDWAAARKEAAHA